MGNGIGYSNFMLNRLFLIVLLLMAQNSTALAQLGLDVTVLCKSQGVQVIWLNAAGEKVEPNSAECDCLGAAILTGFAGFSGKPISSYSVSHYRAPVTGSWSSSEARAPPQI